MLPNLESNWMNWKQTFVTTEKIKKSENKKAKIFLTLIGDHGIKIYNTLKKSDLLESNVEVWSLGEVRNCKISKTILYYIFSSPT